MTTKFILFIFKYNDKEILEQVTELQQFDTFKELYELVSVENFDMDTIKYQGNLKFDDNIFELYSLDSTDYGVNRDYIHIKEFIKSNDLLDRAVLVTMFMNEHGKVFID